MIEWNELLTNAKDRFQLWEAFIQKYSCANISEIGVYKGDFAEYVLKKCPDIGSYTMVDPWRNLSDWNKPANKDDGEFEAYYQEVMSKTAFAKEKIRVLRGKTTEIIGQIEDSSLDFTYIDGDHTLKGITIDLLNIWNKTKPNGYIAGDDFCPSIWKHSEKFEPTMVFPFAIYFAEAMHVKLYALPYNQFLLQKDQSGYEFVDLTNGKYGHTTLKSQIDKKHIKSKPNLFQRLAKKLK